MQVLLVALHGMGLTFVRLSLTQADAWQQVYAYSFLIRGLPSGECAHYATVKIGIILQQHIDKPC